MKAIPIVCYVESETGKRTGYVMPLWLAKQLPSKHPTSMGVVDSGDSLIQNEGGQLKKYGLPL